MSIIYQYISLSSSAKVHSGQTDPLYSLIKTMTHTYTVYIYIKDAIAATDGPSGER